MMPKTNDQNKLIRTAIYQNLLLWEITKSFLDIEATIKNSIKIDKLVS